MSYNLTFNKQISELPDDIQESEDLPGLRNDPPPKPEQPVGDAGQGRTVWQAIRVRYDFPVIFERDVFNLVNPTLSNIVKLGGVIVGQDGARQPGFFAGCESGPRRIAAVFDDGAAAAFPSLANDLRRYTRANSEVMALVEEPLVVPGGERCKADRAVLDQVLELTHRRGLCRQSFILALGGGAVLDAVGFAAATAHRGVRLIRMPSTVLAQNDAGVGVKNGINLFGRKNYWGAFAPPFAVINDLNLLAGLSQRDRRAGLSEAVKVALVRSPAFFAWLQAHAKPLGELEPTAVEQAVERCAVEHMRHIADSGDPFEFGSARPLDFGHWSAHALEETSCGELRHGEAVAVGVALDSVYSALVGLLPEPELEPILVLLEEMGFALMHPTLEKWTEADVTRAVNAFREHLGGRLHLSLITGPGHRVEVHEVDAGLMLQAVDLLRQRGGRRAP